MFNKELKEGFVSSFSTSIGRRNAAVSMFNAIEPYEVKWNADICTRSEEDLRPVIEEIVGFRSNSKKLRLTILKEYIRWCLDNNVVDAKDDIFRIEDFGINKLKRQTVANPQHLQRYLDYVFEKESEETVDCIYRCFYWLAYGGMKEDDVLSVNMDDVDLDNMIVRYDGDEYPIYREAIPAFRNCVNLTQFRYKHPNYSIDKVIYKDRASGRTLLRGIGETKSIKAVRVEMSRRAKNPKNKIDSNNASVAELKLSFYRVWISGLFYRMYEAERAGMPPDFMAAAEQYMEGKTYKLDSGRNTIQAKQRQLAKDYLEDYNRWKEAYSI